MSAFNLIELQNQLHGQKPRAILKAAFEHFDNLAIAFSGAEDIVLIDLAVQIRPDVPVFVLDTGRLHPETYRFIDQARQHYRLNLDILSPEHLALEALVKQKGLFSFYQDGHQECCAIRKVAPLRRKLAQLDAWITGQRKDQSQDTRQDILELEQDAAFSAPDKPLYKFNPLLNWNSAQVWDHIEAYQTPYNSLHQHGYVSIGCEPCTRPVLPNQPERAGRWWWEDASKKECGLHAGNIKN